MLEDVCLLTYTTKKYDDVWPMYFGQLNEFLGPLKSYSLCNSTQEDWPNNGHQLLTYDNDEPYWKQYTDGLAQIKENFVIYAQEDFILFNHVDYEALREYKEFLTKTDYSFVRLIRCGYETPLYKKVSKDLYEVNINSNDAFSMQATLWKKEKLDELYRHVKSQKWLESDAWNNGCRELNIKGCFEWRGEPKIGKFHYDSVVYPYVCTAINRGQWNVDQYPEFMKSMFVKYNVNPNIRGIRIR